MKNEIAAFGLLIIALSACSNDKKTETSEANEKNAQVVSKHSEAFNKSVENFMNAYYAMIQGFINWDTAAVKKQSASFKASLDSFKIDELRKDSLAYPEAERLWHAAKAETDAIVGDNNLDEQRGSLNILSQALFNLLNSIQYDKAKVYYQECPMAFNDENPGSWLSPQAEIQNPYLGTSHPKYHSAMLTCGHSKDSVNFISASK